MLRRRRGPRRPFLVLVLLHIEGVVVPLLVLLLLLLVVLRREEEQGFWGERSEPFKLWPDESVEEDLEEHFGGLRLAAV
jgi:hypothetical protein